MKNLHLEHVEDLVFDGRPAIARVLLLDIFECITEQYPWNLNLSIKWDGAPALIFGEDPVTKEFFIGNKSVFSGKVCHSQSDIMRHYADNPDLRRILIDAHSFLRGMKWDGIWQGDLLWSPGLEMRLKHEFNGLHFKPNTLEYVVPTNSAIFHDVRDSYLGLAIHTKYEGTEFKTLNAQFGKHFITETSQFDGVAFMGTKLVKTIRPVISEKFQFDFLYHLEGIRDLGYERDIQEHFKKPKHNEMIKKFINYCVRYGIQPNTTDWCWFLQEEYHNHSITLKTAKGRKRVYEEMEQELKIGKSATVAAMFRFHNVISELKEMLITVLDTFNRDVEVFLPDGSRVGHEGYVYDGGETVKLVNRHKFSKANFEVAKRWHS